MNDVETNEDKALEQAELRKRKAILEDKFRKGQSISREKLTDVSFRDIYVNRGTAYASRFANVQFRDSRLEHMDFRNALFANCLFLYCTLEGVDFKHASLTYSRFIGCTLKNCKFENADLRNCMFDDTALFNTDFRDAEGVLDLGTPHGYKVLATTWEDQMYIVAGCRRFTLSDARDWWREREDRKLMMPLLDVAEKAWNEKFFGISSTRTGS